MTTAQVVEISATFSYNSPIQDYAHPDNHIPPVYEWILGKTFQYNDNTWQSLTVTVDWLFKLEIYKKKTKKNKHLNMKFVYLCDDIHRQVIFVLI